MPIPPGNHAVGIMIRKRERLRMKGMKVYSDIVIIVFTLQTNVVTILIRYSEIGLKSKPIRKRFETQLKDNIIKMLSNDGIEGLVTSDGSRLYANVADAENATRSIKRVFGVSSLSVTETCGSSMNEICETAAKYSVSRIKEGQTFAVRARREGTHPYNSMELGKEAGSAIFLANKNIKVNLTDPDVTFYIEVRNNRTFIFDSYIRSHAGLPLGSQGRVIAEVNDDRGLLSAWLMMKRGCRTIIVGNYDINVLRAFDPSLKVVAESERDRYRKDILGNVLGTSLENFVTIDVKEYDVPVYFPTIGMSDNEVSEMLDIIRSEI
ncbi:MAG: THUMP domain-containing protein [Methanomassiliicoccaceae archaeon]|nr:THUMP domain-containing protein [Methanomassiliicoccaceae archaeon]